MAEGTRFTKLEKQMHDLTESMNKFMHHMEARIDNLQDQLHARQPSSQVDSEHAAIVTSSFTTNQPRSMRLDVPKFDGTDVHHWLFKIEQFFNFHNTSDDQRLLISSFHLEGIALSWYQWMHANGLISSWQGFLKAVLVRFGPSVYEDPKGALAKLQQTLSVEDYQAKFEELATKGYAGGDEAKMLQRHLSRTSSKIGMGANRVATATSFIKRYGYTDQLSTCFGKNLPCQKLSSSNSDKIGAVILDDGMQHWSLLRDLEIVMINGMMPWGNKRLLPHGPLREPLTALKRADIVVVHHADLVSDKHLKNIKSTVQEVKDSLPIFFSRMCLSHFFEISNCHSKLPLAAVKNTVVLCVSSIGFANAFVLGIEKIGPSYVDRLDFSDHHLFQARDIETIKGRLKRLEDEFGDMPIIIITEKDYDRDPIILKELAQFKVLVLCSSLQILPFSGQTEESFNVLLKKLIG